MSETDRVTDEDVYPYPDDELIYGPDVTWDHDPTKHSYFSLGVMPEPVSLDANGNVHTNDLRLCIHTPFKGTLSFQVNEGDMEHLFAMCAAAFAHYDRPIALDWAQEITKNDWDVKDVFTAFDYGIISDAEYHEMERRIQTLEAQVKRLKARERTR